MYKLGFSSPPDPGSLLQRFFFRCAPPYFLNVSLFFKDSQFSSEDCSSRVPDRGILFRVVLFFPTCLMVPPPSAQVEPFFGGAFEGLRKEGLSVVFSSLTLPRLDPLFFSHQVRLDLCSLGRGPLRFPLGPPPSSAGPLPPCPPSRGFFFFDPTGMVEDCCPSGFLTRRPGPSGEACCRLSFVSPPYPAFPSLRPPSPFFWPLPRTHFFCILTVSPRTYQTSTPPLVHGLVFVPISQGLVTQIILCFLFATSLCFGS